MAIKLMEVPVTKSELINRLSENQGHIPKNDVVMATNLILKTMASRLAGNERIEIRDFGSFSLTYRAERIGRNPKSGQTVQIPGKYVPHFRPGKELRERIDGKAGLR